MTAELFDSHCHLTYDFAPKTADDLIREAQAVGVTRLMVIATDLPSIEQARALSERHAQVWHTAGIHPHEAVSLSDSDLATLAAALRHPKCRAAGELGLDYYYDHSPRDLQIQRLQQQLDLAAEAEQPVVIHSREAEADLLPMLAAYAEKVRAGAPVGVIHCFTGTLPFGKACLDLGFDISFSGILTFKNAEDLREAARAFPLERLLVETDSPYLAPIPHRGRKCEPQMVRFTAMKLAEIKGVSSEEIARVTTANARRLFRL